MKNEFLLSVKDSSHIDVAGGGQLGHKIVHGGDAEAGDDLQVFFIAVFQIGETRSNAKRIKDGIFPSVVLSKWADFFAERIKV